MVVVAVAAGVLVEAAAERTGMIRRRAHTRSLLDRVVAVVMLMAVVVAGDDVAGSGPVG